MSNIIKIAGKELSDLLGNSVVLFLLIMYFLVVLSSVLTVDGALSDGMTNDYMVVTFLVGNLFNSLVLFGAIVAVLLGFYSIYGEKFNGSFSILITKPVYRDSIINGKMIGCSLFMLCLLIVSTMFYIAFALVIIGEPVGAVLGKFFYKSFFIIIFSLAYILTIMGFSMLITLIVKDGSVALLSCAIFFVFISYILPSVSILGNLSILLSEDTSTLSYVIGSLSPYLSVRHVVDNIILNADIAVIDVLYADMPGVFKVLLWPVIVLTLNYIVFIRRDVQ